MGRAKNDSLPVGKLDMNFLSGLLEEYTTSQSQDESVAIGAKIGEDAAVLDLGDRYLVAKTNPITFATEEIGWYVVNVCVNNMVVRGVRPRWMLNCLLLPEGRTTPESVEKIFRQIYDASREVGVSIIGGHTEVTHGLARPIVVGQLIGEVAHEALVATSHAAVGDVILVTKTLAVEGTAIIARELEDTLKGKGLSEGLIERAQEFLHDPGISVFKDALTAAEGGLVHAMTDATEGGLASALHEMAKAAGVGMRIDGDKVPVRSETTRICAALDIDPIGLIASGMLIMTVPSDKVADMQQQMDEAGVPCTPIGVVTPADEGLQLVRSQEVSALPYFATDELTKVL